MNVDKLISQDKPKTVEKTEDEYMREMYLREIEAMKDFRRPGDKICWPSPVGPRWKN